MSLRDKPVAKTYSAETLPEGFTVDEPKAPEGQQQAQQQSPDLPTGFTVDEGKHDAPESKSVLPYMQDQFKKGVAGTLALPNLAVDAIQGGLDTITGGTQKVTKPLSAAVRKLVGLPESADAKAAKKDWFIGNDPEKENVGGYKQAARGWENLLRIDQTLQGKDGTKDVEIPKDAFGGSSKADEYMGKIANFVGGSIIPGIGPVAQAPTKALKLLTAATELIGNTASGISSVEAKEIFGNLAPKFGLTKEQGQEFGEQIGGIMGPGLVKIGAQAATKSAQFGASKMQDANITGFSKEAQKAAAEGMMQEDLLRAVTSNPQSAENIAEVLSIQKKMADFQPNAAQATASPALIAMTKSVAQSSPEALAKAAAVDARNKTAIANFKEKNFPATDLEVNEGARAKSATDKGVLANDLKNTDRELKSLSDQYGRSVDKTEIGQQLRDLYWEKKAVARGKLDAQIKDVYTTAEKYGTKVDMQDVYEGVSKMVNSDKQAFQDMPPVWQKILNTYKPGKPGPSPLTLPVPPKSEVSFEELHSLYKQANKEWMDMTAAGRPDQAQKLDVIRQQLSQKVNNFNTGHGDLSTKFTDFNANYGQYAQTFKQGAGGTVAQLGRKGFAKDAEDIVDKVFLRAGDKSKGLEDFFRVYGNDERAAGLLMDGMTDNFSRATVDANGKFSAAGAARWMKQNDRALDQIPELKAKLQGTTDVAGALTQRKLELVAQRKVLDRTVMSAAAGAQKPELLVEAGMKDPRMFKALLASAKTDESKQALARSIVDMTARKAGNEGFQFLQQNEKTLKPVMDALGKEHWENLTTIAKAEDIANRSKAPTSVELSKVQDPFEKYTGTSGKGLLSRAMNAEKGYASKPYVMADLAGRFAYKFRTEEMARLREAALFDPDVSKLLAKVVTQDRPAAKDLLDLKAISYQFGISIASQAIQARAEGEKPENRNKPKSNPDEGQGLWRRRKSDLMY